MFEIKILSGILNKTKYISCSTTYNGTNNSVFNCSNLVDAPGEKEAMYLEKDILPTLAGTEQVKRIYVIYTV